MAADFGARKVEKSAAQMKELLGERLAKLNPRLAEVVECGFFAGYDEPEAAEVLGRSNYSRNILKIVPAPRSDSRRASA